MKRDNVVLLWTEHSLIPGVPGKDLTYADIEKLGIDVQALLDSGCYVRADFFENDASEEE